MTITKETVEEVVYQYPTGLTSNYTHYCPGCTHGIAHRLIAEVLDELGLRERTIGVIPVGCSALAYLYFNVDSVVAPHGRAPAMATGMRRVLPDNIIFTYQGDGDLAAIGMAEIMWAAARGENITTIFVNNAIYGMTGGQMAPTTLPGQKTTSSPTGRDVETTGMPVKMAEVLAGMEGTCYSARRSLHDARRVLQAKKAILTAFKAQEAGLGFSIVELLSSCPTNWRLTPEEALHWVRDYMVPAYPLGDFKVSDAVKALGQRRR